MEQHDALRTHLVKLLDWQDAHVRLEAALEGIPEDCYGRQPEGLPYSPWQLLEHMRLAQKDILDFCRNPDYETPAWPQDYWPPSAAPPSAQAWQESIAAFRADRRALQQLVENTEVDLFASIPHGEGQTFLREVLLVADHTSYHIGQLIAVRRLLGIWG